MVKLKESPDDMPAGQTPHNVVLYAHSDLVDSVQPGDKVPVCLGIQHSNLYMRSRKVKEVNLLCIFSELGSNSLSQRIYLISHRIYLIT